MSRAIVGIAVGLAVILSAARAGDEKSDENAATATVARAQSDSDTVSKADTDAVIEPGRASGDSSMKESNEARSSFEERWLREREGYRDGGY